MVSYLEAAKDCKQINNGQITYPHSLVHRGMARALSGLVSQAGRFLYPPVP